MSLPVVLRDEAQAEFDEAFDFYESQRAGTGVRFAARVQDCFDRIRTRPEAHAVVFADIRKAVVPRFPFNIMYRHEPSRVHVLAVFHCARDPSIWKNRV
jgi:plasmid stabilization system protein ParE